MDKPRLCTEEIHGEKGDDIVPHRVWSKDVGINPNRLVRLHQKRPQQVGDPFEHEDQQDSKGVELERNDPGEEEEEEEGWGGGGKECQYIENKTRQKIGARTARQETEPTFYAYS